MHPATSASAATRNQTKMRGAHQNPLCSTKHCSLSGSPVSECGISQSVALCSQTVAPSADGLQKLPFVHKPFANCCRSEKTQDSMSRSASAVPLQIGGAKYGQC